VCAGERVTDDRCPEVSDVHLLGDVRCGVIDRDPLRILERHPQPRISRHRGQLVGNPRLAQGEVEEPGAANLHGLTDVAQVEMLHDLRCDVPGWQAYSFGQRKRSIDLDIGELARSQHRIFTTEVRTQRIRDRCGNPGGQNRRWRRHTNRVEAPRTTYWRPASRSVSCDRATLQPDADVEAEIPWKCLPRQTILLRLTFALSPPQMPDWQSAASLTTESSKRVHRRCRRHRLTSAGQRGERHDRMSGTCSAILIAMLDEAESNAIEARCRAASPGAMACLC